MGVWIVLAALVPALAAGSGCRRLLMLRARVQNAWSPLQARLGWRHDRIRDLLGAMGETTDMGAEASRGLTAAFRQALDARGIPAQAEAENELTRALHLLFTDAQTDGWADRPRIRALCEELIGAEEEMVLAARAYNQEVMTWNQKIHQLPWSLMADLCHFQSIEYFVLDDPDAHVVPHVPI
jgi:hypothetical protein